MDGRTSFYPRMSFPPDYYDYVGGADFIDGNVYEYLIDQHYIDMHMHVISQYNHIESTGKSFCTPYHKGKMGKKTEGEGEEKKRHKFSIIMHA